MKRCYRRIAASTSTRTDIPDREPEGEGRQSMMEEEEVTSPIPFDRSDNSDSSGPAPPAIIDGEIEDQTQDPTWYPEGRQGNQLPADGTSSSGEDSAARYGLRSRQGESPGTLDATQTEVAGETAEKAETETEPPTNSADESESDQVKKGPTPSYNLHPFPGRRF
jgi:hypothetical protein